MDDLIEALKNLWPHVVAVGGLVGTIGGVIGTFVYRRRSIRQRQVLIDLESARSKQRVELTHAAFQEFRGAKPPLLQVRIVVRNRSDRQEVIRGVFLENGRDGSSQVYFEGQHELGPQGVLELSAERAMPKELPTQFLIQLIDGSISGPLKEETTSHGVFPVLTPEQLQALATGDFQNPLHPFHGQQE